MGETPPSEDLRLVRILTPGALLREVDSLVLRGRGGYQSRQEFFLDAIENQLLEVKYGGLDGDQRRLPLAGSRDAKPLGAPDNGSPPAENSGQAVAAPEPPALTNGGPIREFTDFSETELHPPASGPTIATGVAQAPTDEPLFGLHNRDYPSLWAAEQLARLTQGGPISLKTFLDATVVEAWRFAARLEVLDEQATTKLTALFPKNRAKPQSAEESFRAFAIGSLAKKPLPGGKLKASGPLYTWGLAQIERQGEENRIGLTDAGYELLGQLDGLSLRLPHQDHFAERFLDFLAKHAPGDAAGFDHLLKVVPEGLTRTELAGRFKQWHPGWSDTEANTHAAAYVARAREWGLLEEKLVDRSYELTEFGQRLAGVEA